MNELETKVIELIETAEGLAPQATDAVLAATQLTGVGLILTGLIFLALSIGASWIGRNEYRKVFAAETAKFNEEANEDGVIIRKVRLDSTTGTIERERTITEPDHETSSFVKWASRIISSVLFIGSLIFLANIWNWTAIFAPAVYLAKTLTGV